MLTCNHCRGFVPDQLDACPHCSTSISRALRHAARGASCGAMMMTLMACYGLAYDGEDYQDPDAPCDDYASDPCLPPDEGPRCGDGQVNGVEQCDDANTSDGDGCDSACRVELCASATPLDADEVAGDTKNGSARFHLDCDSYHGFGREQVFSYEVSEPGVLDLQLSGGSQLGLYVTSECSAVASVPVSDAAGDAACTGPDPGGASLSVALQPGYHWIVVDGANDGDTGAPFLLQHAFTVACGNGELQAWAGEQCDDGNLDSGDGCDASCRPEHDFVCQEAQPLLAGLAAGDTSTGSQALACGDREQLYRFDAPSAGTVSLIASADFDLKVALLDGCSAAALAAPSCIDEQGPALPEVVSRFVAAGESLWIGIDSPVDGAGPFTLDLSFTPL